MSPHDVANDGPNQNGADVVGVSRPAERREEPWNSLSHWEEAAVRARGIAASHGWVKGPREPRDVGLDNLGFDEHVDGADDAENDPGQIEYLEERQDHKAVSQAGEDVPLDEEEKGVACHRHDDEAIRKPLRECDTSSAQPPRCEGRGEDR